MTRLISSVSISIFAEGNCSPIEITAYATQMVDSVKLKIVKLFIFSFIHLFANDIMYISSFTILSSYVINSSVSERIKSVNCWLFDVDRNDKSRRQDPDFFKMEWSRADGPCSCPILKVKRVYLWKKQSEFCWIRSYSFVRSSHVSSYPHPLSLNMSGVIAIPRSSFNVSSSNARYNRV